MVRHLWRHDIWISEKSKIDFLKNDKNFTEMKDPFSLVHKSSVKWQKGESRSACFKKKKQSTRNFPKNEHFLPPDTHTCKSQNRCFKKTARQIFPKTNTYVCVSGGKKCSFFGKFGVHCFLETRVLRFALFPYYRRNALFNLKTQTSKSVTDTTFKQWFDWFN